MKKCKVAQALVVDDEPCNLHAAADHLSLYGISITKGYDEILRENRRLKNEIGRMKRTEKELRGTRRLLSGALDAVDHAVMAVNENAEITLYCRSFSDLFGHSEIDLPGKSFPDMIYLEARGNTIEFKEALMSKGVEAGEVEKYGGIRFRRKDISIFSGDVLLHPFALEDESVVVTIIQEHSKPSEREVKKSNPAYAPELIDALIRRLEQFEVFEIALRDMLPRALERQADVKRISGGGDASRDYVDPSPEDVLDMETLPKKPRWRQVVKTARYALSMCEASTPLRTSLETSLENLQPLM